MYVFWIGKRHALAHARPKGARRTYRGALSELGVVRCARYVRGYTWCFAEALSLPTTVYSCSISLYSARVLFSMFFSVLLRSQRLLTACFSAFFSAYFSLVGQRVCKASCLACFYSTCFSACFRRVFCSVFRHVCAGLVSGMLSGNFVDTCIFFSMFPQREFFGVFFSVFSACLSEFSSGTILRSFSEFGSVCFRCVFSVCILVCLLGSSMFF